MEMKKEALNKPHAQMALFWNNKEKTPSDREGKLEVGSVGRLGLLKEDDLKFIMENICKSTTERQLLESVIFDHDVPFSPL